MQELWRLLSSPRNLVVFEAAARHGSFTRAAEELNIQQPAVSAAIRQMEQSLGVSLFQRAHKKVTLTAAGRRLFADASAALEQVLDSARAVRRLSHNDHVTLNASSAFNTYWMLPRLHDLHAQHPEIDLRLQSSDREPDIDAETISLAVRRGSGDWPDVHCELIALERIFPVASPQVVAAAINLEAAPDLLHEKLIHLEEPIRERPTWRQWFASFGVAAATPDAGLRLNDYALVLQAAMSGEGFAFGWEHVTEPLIERGLLSARREWTWETGFGFYLVWSRTRSLSAPADHVRAWILGRAALR